jgi:Tfp pilus assembly protein PilV
VRCPSDRDRGDIVLGWLTRVVIVLSVLGVLGYDVVSVIYTQVSAADVASQAAQAAGDSWSARKDIEAAYDAAELTAEGEGGTVPRSSMSIDPSGTVKLSVVKTAPTFVLQYTGVLKKVATATRAGQAKTL